MNSEAPGGPFHRTVDWRFLLGAVAITMLSCLINLPGVTHAEVIDDHDLLHNRQYRGCGRNPVDCFYHAQFALYYRPIMGASFSIGENLHGQSPYAFHVENLALHAIVMLEACWVFRLILRRKRTALLAALLFGVHPLQVPVTTFIGGRTDSLALLFAFWFVIGAVKSAGSRHVWLWRTVSLAGYSAAVFCKEQCVPLVLLLPFLLQFGPRRVRPTTRARTASPAWMLLYAFPIIALFMAARRVIPPGAIDTVAWKPTAGAVTWDLGLRIEMIGRTVWYYVRSFFWPTVHTLHQSSLGPWDTPQLFTALGGFFAAGAWMAVSAHTWPDRRARILALWTTLTLLPCLNVFPIPSQFVACYRASIPVFGIAGLAAMLFDRLISVLARRQGLILAWANPVAVASALAMLSSADVPVWRSDTAVTLAEYQGDPNFLPALAGYAIMLRREGKLREAVAANDTVVSRLFPGQTTWQERVALLDTPWMLRHVKSLSSLRYDPRRFADYVFRERGGAKQDLGMCQAAIDDYRVAFAAMPTDLQVGDALVTCCEVSGQYEDERQVLEAIIARASTSTRLHRLGATYLHLGRWLDAKDALAGALTLADREKSPNAPAILRMYQRAEALTRTRTRRGPPRPSPVPRTS